MGKILANLIVLVLIVLFSSCNKEKLKAPVAAYIKIDSTGIISDPFSQGSSNSKITDIWVYVNQQFKGAYPVGNLIPIVSEGSTDILIFPGIKNNGISATRQPYTFLQGLNINLDLKPEQTTVIKPLFPYKTSAYFQQIEGFEGPGISVTTATNSNMPYVITSSTTTPVSDVFEGQHSLYMTMTDQNPTCAIRSSSMYSLPASGAAVYMELNYKSNQAFQVGVYNSNEERAALTVNSTNGEWKKIYISLTAVVSNQPSYPLNGFYIKAVKSVDNPEILLDNIKLISE